MYRKLDEKMNLRRLGFFFFILALVLGTLHLWHERNYFDPDGISYLDMGEAYLRGDWKMAINGLWSPLYAILLGIAIFVFEPSPYWEFSVVHFVNFTIYIFSFFCFSVFLVELIQQNRHWREKFIAEEDLCLPDWGLLVIGYSFFIWSSIKLIMLWAPEPDLLLASIIYLVFATLLRISMGYTGIFTFIIFGFILAIGYLTKAAMFPMSFVFFSVSFFLVGNFRKALIRVGLSFLVFCVIAGPFIVGLSSIKGRLTYGESGKLNYVWHVNQTKNFIHWQGEEPESGRPVHPTRKIYEEPAIYEFGTPVGGTYPPWYDPSYWYEGVQVKLDLKKQIKVVIAHAFEYFDFLLLQGGQIAGFLILCFMCRSRSLCLRMLWRKWFLLIPAIAAFAMYSLVHVEWRYLGAYITILWLGLFSGIAIPDSEEFRRVIVGAIIAVTLFTLSTMVPSTARAVYHGVRDIKRSQDISSVIHSGHDQWEIANHLKQNGIQPGDKVGCIGYTFGAYWARLARLKIVAEITRKDAKKFWAANDLTKSEVFRAFEKTGARIIVANHVPSFANTMGWQMIGKTNHYVFYLSKQAKIAEVLSHH